MSGAKFVAVSDAVARRNTRLFRAAGGITLIAAVLVAVGSITAWVSYAVPAGATVSRDGFQFGDGYTWTWFGPVLVAGACMLATAGIVVLFKLWHPNPCMTFIPTMIVGLEIAEQWHGGFGGAAGATTTLGPGSFLCLAGVALGVAATVLLIPTERVRTR